MKEVFIIGAGFTGMRLAQMLVAERREVVLIDKNPERIKFALGRLDCRAIEAEGADFSVLERSGIGSADSLVALTGDDETNIAVSSLVETVWPDVRKIARVRNFSYYTAASLARQRAGEAGSLPLCGIDRMLNPDVEASSAIVRAVRYGAVGNVIDLPGEYVLLTVKLGEGSVLTGVPLRELKGIAGWKNVIAFVESQGEAFLPNGETILKPGDVFGVVSKKDEISSLVKTTCSDDAEFKKIVIFGADRVGMLLVSQFATKLNSSIWSKLFGSSSPRSEVVVVDRDIDRCNEIAQRFPSVRTVCGDFTDSALIADEDLCNCDLLVAASGDREKNLLTAAYMKSRGVGRCIALTENSAYDEISSKLGVDVTVSLRESVVDGILSCLRGGNVSSVHSVCNRRYEIVEGEISDSSSVAGKNLSEIGSGGLECLVLLVTSPSGEETVVPNGNTVLEEGSRIVLIAPAGNTVLLRRFFGEG
jgi:trk system potassium uptake protein TrkA